MKSRLLIARNPLTYIVPILIGLCCLLPLTSLAQAQPTAVSQKGFDTPQAAADAIIKAAGDYNVPESAGDPWP